MEESDDSDRRSFACPVGDTFFLLLMAKDHTDESYPNILRICGPTSTYMWAPDSSPIKR